MLALVALACRAAMTTNPPGVIPWSGGVTATATTTVTNSYDAVATDYFILVKGTNKNVTLPSLGAGIAAGKEYLIKSASPEGTNVVIVTAMFDNNASTYDLTNCAYVRFRSDGTRYWIIGNGP